MATLRKGRYKMKVTLNKKVFSLAETNEIKQFKAEWGTPSTDDIKSAVRTTAYSLGICFDKLIAVSEIELTKNRFKSTYWVTAIVKGTTEDCKEIYAEIGFDYIQAIMACPDDKIDNFTLIYKRV